MSKKDQLIEMIRVELKHGPLFSVWPAEDGYEGYVIRQDGSFRGVEEAVASGVLEDLEAKTLAKILGEGSRLEASDYFKEMLQLPIIQFLHELHENRSSQFNGRAYSFQEGDLTAEALHSHVYANTKLELKKDAYYLKDGELKVLKAGFDIPARPSGYETDPWVLFFDDGMSIRVPIEQTNFTLPLKNKMGR